MTTLGGASWDVQPPLPCVQVVYFPERVCITSLRWDSVDNVISLTSAEDLNVRPSEQWHELLPPLKQDAPMLVDRIVDNILATSPR